MLVCSHSPYCLRGASTSLALCASEMVHIKQNDRVMVGLDGSLYFANLLKSDSRDDYVCNAQYSAARTILPETSVRLTVMPSE